MNTERPDDDTPGVTASGQDAGGEDTGDARSAAADGDGPTTSDSPDDGPGTPDTPDISGAKAEPEAEPEAEAEDSSATEPGPRAETTPDDGEAEQAPPTAENEGSDDGDSNDGDDGEIAASAAEEPAPAEEAAPDLLVTPAPTPSRPRSRLVVASVAAAVLLVGGGGAYLAAASGGSGDSGGGDAAPGSDGAPPALALDGYGTGTGTGTAAGIAVGEPNPYGSTYVASGTLPDGPKDAAVYRSEGKVTRAEVTRLAEALDVSGTPKLTDGSWTVGVTKDGSGAVLSVAQQAPGAWTFSRSTARSDDLCDGMKLCAGSGTAQSGDAVGAAVAKKAAAPVLKAVGQDSAKLDTSQVAGALRVVNATPEVGGLPTYGWTTGIQVGADGQVTGGSGNLKAPAKGDTYPVISAKETLKLVNEGTGDSSGAKGVGGCATSVPLQGEDGQSTPCAGASASATEVPVEGAEFGLAARSVNGAPVLVPSWLFEVRPQGATDTVTVAHPAVAPEYLTAPSTPTPTATPSGSGATVHKDVEVLGYTADGSDLTITYEGGVCGSYSRSVAETSGEVTVTVTHTYDADAICIMMAKVYHEKVQLKDPLDGRKVVGSDGRTVPKGSLELDIQPQR